VRSDRPITPPDPHPITPSPSASHGLTDAEVAERVRRGQVNRTPRRVVRDYARIVARNVFTWFNAMVTPAAVALFILDDKLASSVTVSAMAVINTALGLIQEIRAKYHLDKLALLVEAKARVVRQGSVRTIPSSDVVLGDHIQLTTGETVVADGPILEARFLEIDEALLTGESDPVRRSPGEQLLSGSFCVAGETVYRADKVGSEAFANRTSAEARHYRFVASPLTQVINRIVQILTYTAIALIALYTLAYWMKGFPTDREEQAEFVRMIAATITSMVPQGLVLTATMAFTLGALVMSRRGAVVQRLSAVETMAAIDVICTDKTGTLTTNQLRLERVVPLDPALPDIEARRLLALFANASIDRGNRNLVALRQALGDGQVELLDQIPFKSQNRYSAVRVRDGQSTRLLVLGAVEALRDRFDQRVVRPESAKGVTAGHASAPFEDAGHATLDEVVGKLQHQGLRLLVLAEGGAEQALANATQLPTMPLRPVCLACLGDELRPESGAVLEQLSAQGIAFKVLSGDNPETVQGTVRHLNLPWAHDPVVAGDQLRQVENREQLILERSVFGRVAPEQKVDIVATLQRHGKHVAMIGDGVNDVLPIKRADLGIAMGDGSQASKRVAGLVLEKNQFALLPETLEEGRTIVRNLRRSAKLFLVKNVYTFILIVAYYCGWFGLPFPYEPQQVTLLNWSVIGIPAFIITLSRERSTSATKPRFLREVANFALRTGILFGLAGVLILTLAGLAHQQVDSTMREEWQRTMLLSLLILLGITALFRALTDGEPQALRGDRRFQVLGLLAIPVYLTAMYVPSIAQFFVLRPLGIIDWGLVLFVAVGTYLLSLVSDRICGTDYGDDTSPGDYGLP
jgi:cation-transporting P-type ATPase E